ncbi:hypothetical protein NVP1101O_064 [Vibrio phage 1.101.O._10N.261.45.C6]|nr:hypothetical protein NVP1101O_064 [Vibrio phage 1.101.O._10N.261.45.C6]
MKFGNKGFTPSANVQEETTPQKPFVRDESDNKLFTSIQVKDIRDIITEDCVGHFDFDTTLWKACANMENKYIVAKHITEGWEEEFKNVTTFRGMGKGIKPSSWLGMKNVEREVEGKEPYKLEDFEVTNCARLKIDKDKAIEQAKIQIHLKMKQIRQQFRVPKIMVHIGAGECFRHSLDLVRPYKGNRAESSRPIILKEIRSWVEKELLCEVTREGFEADDRVEHYGFQGYVDYLKKGKFSHIVLASDKDAKNNPKLLIDPDTYTGDENPLKGQFKFPQAMLILDSTKDAGDIGIIQKASSSDYKFYGFKGLLWQAFLSGDGADNYSCTSHLGQNLNFGDESAYRLIKPCETAYDALQTTIDKFAELLPYGVQYLNHRGEELDVDTMSYMNTYFKVAYMTRSYEDQVDFYQLCEKMKVDTSKITDNNHYTPPKRVFVGNEESVENVVSLVQEILKEDFKSIKTLKKADLSPRLDLIKEKLQTLLDVESHYEMQQELKPQFADKIDKE